MLHGKKGLIKSGHMKRESAQAPMPPFERFTPWYGTENMETDKACITGTGGGIVMRQPASKLDQDQQRLWKARCYVQLTSENAGLLDRRFSWQKDMPKQILGRPIEITIV